MRIPYDSLTLAAVTEEAQEFVGGKVQKISQPDEATIVLEIYAHGRAQLLLCSHGEYFRAHFSTRKPRSQQPLPGLGQALRARVEGGRIEAIAQRGSDRVLDVDISTQAGPYRLVAELMGRHANLILLDAEERCLAAARWVDPRRSKRPIQPGKPYHAPPLADETKVPSGTSPFLKKLLEAGDAGLRDQVRDHRFDPVLSEGHGAYPVSVAALGLPEIRRASTSIALEQHYERAIREDRVIALRNRLRTQLQRVLLAREVALGDLEQTERAAERAGEDQMKGELLLAYAREVDPSTSSYTTHDYEGGILAIKLDPTKSPIENADVYFAKARKAKSGASSIQQQRARLAADRFALVESLSAIENAETLTDLESLQEAADERRWLLRGAAPSKKKEERPFEGHKVKELLGPGNVRVLYGENATANDYLTTRVAKPNDYWLHVRGSQSAHVVIPTQNKPERISREVLVFAAKVAIRNSASKHSSHVPVDYTLKKYVRKPKGSPVGFAVYTHEKTLHLDVGD